MSAVLFGLMILTVWAHPDLGQFQIALHSYSLMPFLAKWCSTNLSLLKNFIKIFTQLPLPQLTINHSYQVRHLLLGLLGLCIYLHIKKRQPHLNFILATASAQFLVFFEFEASLLIFMLPLFSERYHDIGTNYSCIKLYYIILASLLLLTAGFMTLWLVEEYQGRSWYNDLISGQRFPQIWRGRVGVLYEPISSEERRVEEYFHIMKRERHMRYTLYGAPILLGLAGFLISPQSKFVVFSFFNFLMARFVGLLLKKSAYHCHASLIPGAKETLPKRAPDGTLQQSTIYGKAGYASPSEAEKLLQGRGG